MGKLKLRVPKWNVVKPTGTKLLSEVMTLTDYQAREVSKAEAKDYDGVWTKLRGQIGQFI